MTEHSEAIKQIHLGVKLADQGQIELACKRYRQAIIHDPKYFVAYSFLCSALNDLSNYNEAIQVIGEAIQIDPSNADAHYWKGYTLKNQGEVNQACDCYRQAIKLDPKYFIAYSFLCSALSELNQYEEAIQVVEEAIRLDPSNSCAYFQMKYAQNEIIKKQQIVMQQAMDNAGTYDIVQIQIGWNKYKQESDELFDYIKSFYWTLLNYFDGCRISSSGVLTKNLNAFEDDKVVTSMESLAFTTELGISFPLVGTVFIEMDTLFLDVYGKIISTRYENQIHSINKIIMDNYSWDELHRTIAKATLEIAQRKQATQFSFVVNEELDIFGQVETKPNYFWESVKPKFDEFFVSPVIEGIDLYISRAGRQALMDVTKMLIHLTAENDKILKATSLGELYKLIADSVTQYKFQEWINEIDIMESTYQKTLLQAIEPPDTQQQNLCNYCSSGSSLCEIM